MSEDAGNIVNQMLLDTQDLTIPLTGDLAETNLAQARFDAAVDLQNTLVYDLGQHLQNIRDAMVVDYMYEWPALDVIDYGGLDGIVANEPPPPAIGTIVVPPVDFTEPKPVPGDVTITTDPPPEFSGSMPPIDIPPAPTEPFPSFSEDPPQISDPDIPIKPTYNIPPVPVIDDISVPSPPDYNFPDWEGTPPSMDLTPPEPMFAWNEAEYDSTLKQLLSSKLADELVNGGSGIDPAWEAAFLARMRNNLAEKHEEMYAEVENRWAGRGFTMPPGALAGQILEIQKQVLRDEENLANDIIIKQEELAFEYGKFIVDVTIQYEKNLMDYTNDYNNRAFEAAKFNVESALTVYQARVEAYKAQLTAYQVLAQVFESRIRAEVARAELYKAQIEGVKANVDIKEALIEAYKAQIAGIATLVDLYRAEMQGAQVKAEVDRTRIESFQALVQAYAARIGAVTARYEAYQSQVEGEAAKVKAYQAQAEAFNAEVQGYAAKAQVDVSRAEAELKINLSEVDVFKAMIEKYRADVEKALKGVDAQIAIEQLDVAVYQELTKNYHGELDALLRLYHERVEEYKAKTELVIKQMDITIATIRANATMAAAAAEAGARVQAATIAAAYAGISTTVSYGYREVRSDSKSQAQHDSRVHQGQASVGHYTHVNKQG